MFRSKQPAPPPLPVYTTIHTRTGEPLNVGYMLRMARDIIHNPMRSQTEKDLAMVLEAALMALQNREPPR